MSIISLLILTGLILFVIAIIIFTRVANKSKSIENINCKHCNAPISTLNKYCPNCGNKIDTNV